MKIDTACLFLLTVYSFGMLLHTAAQGMWPLALLWVVLDAYLIHLSFKFWMEE